ncbi:peptidase C39 family protein [Candidatus Marsarchaeota archaeon]|nr:peptidase C39 family protein [Candidatus Marsarchaeota archaeon]
MARKTKTANRTSKRAASREAKIFEIPNYAQTERFTSSAACAIMVLKYLNKRMPVSKETEYKIWQQAVSGSVWYGSRYGLAYALAQRGARTEIISDVRDEGYEKKLAVYEGINLDTLSASFNEVRDKARALKVKESHGRASINAIKKTLNSNKIPIVVIDAKSINPELDSSPHWVVVKGYDKDTFYINDPYSDITVTMEPEAFKAALGYENETHMITVSARKR